MEKGKTRDKIVAAIAIIAVLAVVLAVGFYQEEVFGYFRLQGWNLQPAEQATRDFLAAAAKGDGQAVARMVGKPSDVLVPIRSGDKVTGFTIMEYGAGPKNYTLQQLVPSTEATLSPPRLVLMDGGSVAVDATFPRAYTLNMKWDNSDGPWKLRAFARSAPNTK